MSASSPAAKAATDMPTSVSAALTLARFQRRFVFRGSWQREFDLAAGQAVELSVGLERPSELPPNGRLRASWARVEGAALAEGVTADWVKTLHALDPDVYMIYRAPAAGRYRLALTPVETEPQPQGELFREAGQAPAATPLPTLTPWPEDVRAKVRVELRPVASLTEGDTVLEAEPNDGPAQAQPVPLAAGDADQTVRVMAGADDVEYFNNARFGEAGADWYRLEYRGTRPKLLTANLAIVEPTVIARIQAFAPDPKRDPAGSVRVVEYDEGKDLNEVRHQQEELYRTFITRTLQPRRVLFLRVEANAPGYELELRLRDPAPYADPRAALKAAIYYHTAEVDAWLIDRPRGIGLDRRAKDTSNLLGGGCMSCHTQSGVWGPAAAFAQGYRPENAQNWRRLVNTMYETCRPTNHLKEAAANTSLAPLDLGDAPAGTRVAGHNIATAERFEPAKRLHRFQLFRTANYALQTADPGGVNAADKGSNLGRAVVLSYTGEILRAAWDRTKEPRYLRALEDRARAVLELTPRYTDDLCHRVEFLTRFFPADFPTLARAAYGGGNDRARTGGAGRLMEQIHQQVAADLARLEAVQQPEGGWGFTPGRQEGGRWLPVAEAADPSPTALALTALQVAGRTADDAAVARGVKALLAMQHPYGLWNRSAITGFVTNAYAIKALAPLFPVEPPRWMRNDFRPRRGESPLQALRRVRALSDTNEPALAGRMLEAARSRSPQVRYWAMVGLGGARAEQGVQTLLRGLDDPVKMVREAAAWALRQSLLEDRGWDQVTRAKLKSDQARAHRLQALNMLVDAAGAGSPRRAESAVALLTAGFHDPAPLARAFTFKAAKNWWVWNPATREAINREWAAAFARPEPNAGVEVAFRYSTHSLLNVNGHVANGTRAEEQQYRGLDQLYALLTDTADGATDVATQNRITTRMTAIAATHYGERGGDGGPGQLGTVTKGSEAFVGRAVLASLARSGEDRRRVRLALEAAANVGHAPLQKEVLRRLLTGPIENADVAARALTDPRSVTLIATPEGLQPLLIRLATFARDDQRPAVDAMANLLRRVQLEMPKDAAAQHEVLRLLIPTAASPRLTEALATVMAENPDLRVRPVFDFVPTGPVDGEQSYFWLKSLPWLLSFPPGADASDETVSRAKEQLIRLYISQLAPEAMRRNRLLAAQLANAQAMVRGNPEARAPLVAARERETDGEIRDQIANTFKTERGEVVRRLRQLLQAAPGHGLPTSADGGPSDALVEDFTFFHDRVSAELGRRNRADDRACLSCHGIPGRVPTLTLQPPDANGYLSIEAVFGNYRKLQERVDLADVERSRLLRKPLNVQTGQEDGHQGGKRYEATDPGYQVLRQWALAQPRLREAAARAQQAQK
jgi:hypothetical protein